MVIIIDYEMGNLRSIYNAFVALGCDTKITRSYKDFDDAKLIVLPGVGAFEEGIKKLKKLKMIDALNEQVISKGKAYLGICLGFQFLATESWEHGITKGFNWIPGIVEKIIPNNRKFKVPHMGWNDVDVHKPEIMFDGLGGNPVFYFVHSYSFKPDDECAHYVTSTCWHGTEIAATVRRDNIYGVQFHPEKSQAVGLKLLQNIVSSVEKD